MKKHIIWSNINLDPEDWRLDYEEYAEENGLEISEDGLYEWMLETNDIYLDDERSNLDIKLDGRILVIADLGLWNGRRQGYKIIRGNIADILYDESDYAEWYSDDYNIRAKAIHHDGTNYYLYREIREERNIQNLLDAIYNGEEISRSKLNYYTKSINPYVKKVYGW